MISRQMFRRVAAPLFLAVLVAGCSSSGSPGAPSSGSVRNDECRFNRSACIYEGSYESGERDYAEEEAARLNQATIRRLQRGAWR